MLAPIETPEEQELASKRAELARLEGELAERELQLATLQAELGAFDALYVRSVGRLFAELDELRAQTSEAEARRRPDNPDYRQKAEAARSYADASADAVKAAGGPACIKFLPNDDLKRLYRQLARLVHPDLANDDIDRIRRNRFMAEVTRAYRAGDDMKLRALLNEWQLSPESVSGEGVGVELVRTIRKIHQVRGRLVIIEADTATLRQSELFALKQEAEAATTSGRDLLAEMAQQLNAEIGRLRGAMAVERTP